MVTSCGGLSSALCPFSESGDPITNVPGRMRTSLIATPLPRSNVTLAGIGFGAGPNFDGPTRQYSLCGDCSDRRTWRLGILREPDGRGGSRYVHDTLQAGDTVRIRGPRNNFALIDAPRYLFIAGGIGITPILPMIRAVEAAGAE